MNECCICKEETYAGRYCIKCLEKEAPQGLDDLAASIGVYANAIVEQNKRQNEQLLGIFKPMNTKDNE